MPGQKDATARLAESMLLVLRQRKQRGGDAPLTLEQLARLADAGASLKTILSAIRTKRFGQQAVVARRELGAPAALADDIPRFASSAALFLFALASKRTPANHAASPSELKSKLTGKLQKPFQEAVNRQLADGTVPPGVGWVLIRNTKKLFLLSDLHTGPKDKVSVIAPPPEPPPARATAARLPTAELDFGRGFADAFARLDQQTGGHNFVSLLGLRDALPLPRDRFDAELRQLRLAGRYTLSAAEGRHGLTPAEHEAGIVENGTLLLYVSRKLP